MGTFKRQVFVSLLAALTAVSLPAAPASAATYGGEIIDLSNWKLTLPIGPLESPIEIKQPNLATYSINPYFTINPAGDGVMFRAPVNGVTTSGSSYPRSELREMNGTNRASWSTTSGIHTMYIDQAVTAVPAAKQHIVVGQIHDGVDDVIVIRLQYPKLYIDINGTAGPTLDPNYALGKRFNVKFVAAGGQIKIYYNGSTTAAYVLNRSGSGNYFKAGAYTQSNTSKETDDSSNNYGEVCIYNLLVTHGSSTTATTNSSTSLNSSTGSTLISSNTSTATPPQPIVNGPIFEAEAGLIASPMKIVSDLSASNGKYAVQTTDSGTGYVKYSVSIPSTGAYKLRARVITPDGSSNSVTYYMDGSSANIWHFPQVTKWTWADGPTLALSQGTHTFTVYKREKNTRLDAFEFRIQ